MNNRLIKKTLSVLLSAAVLVTSVPLTSLGTTADAAKTATVIDNVSKLPSGGLTTGTYILKDITVNAAAGKSAIVINGDVTLIIEGTVNLQGGNAYFKDRIINMQRNDNYSDVVIFSDLKLYDSIGAGAGIEVPVGSSLTLKGSGTLNATGGNAADGQEGTYYGSSDNRGNSGIYNPLADCKGNGGGGAGAGIGGKGADNSSKNFSVGNITVADKMLRVCATGGAGGKGGKGGDGTKGNMNWSRADQQALMDACERAVPSLNTLISLGYVRCAMKSVFFGIGFTHIKEATMRGGYGGGGGGGGGYPAAGIGTGGAAGGNGGMGGSPGQDKYSCAYVQTAATFFYPVEKPGWYSCGGGGGGAYNVGFDIFDGLFAFTSDKILYGDERKGGAAGQNGEEQTSATVKGHTAYSGPSGRSPSQDEARKSSNFAQLMPGFFEGGEGNNNVKASGSGGTSGPVGRKSPAGKVTINGGIVTANGGGGEAKNIGEGDGGGTASSGELIINSGSLQTTDKIPTPTNGTKRLYPVKVKPYEIDTDFALNKTTDVTVDGKEYASCRFEDQLGNITLWLDSSVHNVSISQPIKSDYSISVDENGKATTKQTGNYTTPLLKLDSTQLNISGTNYTVNNSSGVLRSGTLTSSEINVSGYGSVYFNSSGNYTLNLSKDCNLYDLWVSRYYTSGNDATVTLKGNGTNKIHDIMISHPKSEIEFVGDESNAIEVGSIDMPGNCQELKLVNGGVYINQNELRIYSYPNDDNTRPQNVSYITYDLNDSAGGNDIYFGLNKRAEGPDTTAFNSDFYSSSELWAEPTWKKETENEKTGLAHLQPEVVYDFKVLSSNSGYNSSTYETADGEVYRMCQSATGTSADLNLKASGTYLYLFSLSYKDIPESRKSYWVNRGPVTGIGIKSSDGSGVKSEPNGYITACYNEVVNYFGSSNAADLNQGIKGSKTLHLYVGRNYKDTYKDSNGNVVNVMESNDSQRCGSILMNSKGNVSIGSINVKGRPGFFYGTPYIVVNSGRLTFKKFLNFDSANLTEGINRFNYGLVHYAPTNESVQPNCNIFTSPTWIHSQTWDRTNMMNEVYTDYHGNVFKDNQYTTQYSIGNITKSDRIRQNFYGNNRISSIHVNGGTLQVGDDGKGKIAIENGYTQTSDDPVLYVEPGANVLADVSSEVIWGNKTKVEITGLPANSHLKKISDTFHNQMLPADGLTDLLTGEYDEIYDPQNNEDVWTNANGNFITYFYDTYYSDKECVAFYDEQGYAYVYSVVVSNGTPTVTKVKNGSFDNFNSKYRSYSDDQQTPEYINQHYMTVFCDPNGHVPRQLVCDVTSPSRLNRDIKYGLVLMNDTELTLSNDAVRTIENSITGEGRLTIDGAGINTGNIDITSFTVKQGTVTAQSIKGDVKILGGSVKTNNPLANVNGADGEVYLAVIPTWDVDTTVDGKKYPGLSGGGHGDGKMYLYVPSTAKRLVANGRCFYLSYNSENKTMDVIEREDSDGLIDLSLSSVEIFSNNEYFYNGKYFYNLSGNSYNVSGTSNKNTLTISDSNNVNVTLNNLNSTLLKGSPIVMSNSSVNIKLSGENTLAGADGCPAIQVPSGSTVTISGDGKLKAAGGMFAAAVGGANGQDSGTIKISSGILNLTGNSNSAVGAGSGGKTGSIIVDGGSIYANNTSGGSGFGTTPTNSAGSTLRCLSFTPSTVGGSGITLGGSNYSAANINGKFNFYVPTQASTLNTTGGQRTVFPWKITSVNNGVIDAYIIDNGEERKLNVNDDDNDNNDNDMVIEGSEIRLKSIPNSDYGVKQGPIDTTYKLQRDSNDNLVLYPIKDESMYFINYGDRWTQVTHTSENGQQNTINGIEKTIKSGETEIIDFGYATTGNQFVAGFTATGEGVTAEILVNSKVEQTVQLSGTEQNISYQWNAEKNDFVSVRFTGAGKVHIASVVFENVLSVNNTNYVVQANTVFENVYTLNITQPDVEQDNVRGYISAFDSNDRAVVDRDFSRNGIQLFAGETVKLVYADYNAGDYFKNFIINNITYDSNNIIITMDSNKNVSVNTNTVPYHSVRVNLGSNMTCTGNNLSQDVKLETNMDSITITASDGYCFPSDYISNISSVTDGSINGLTISRAEDSDTTITISGIPTKDTDIKLPDAEARSYTLTVTAPEFTETYTYGYSRPEPKQITIKSDGNSTTTIESVALAENGSDVFELSSTTGSTVAAGTSNTTYTIQPKTGLNAGGHSAQLVVTYKNGTSAEGEVITATAKATVNFAVAKAGQTAPDVPTATVTDNTISVTAPENGKTVQYACVEGTAAPENIPWEDSNEFTNLKAATAYTCYVRFAESTNYLASDSASAVIYTAASAPDASVVTFNYSDETISLGSEYEVSASADFDVDSSIASGSNITEYIADYGTTEKELYVRVKEVLGGVPASAATTVTVKARPQTPGASATATASTITLTSNANWEYSKDGANWNDGTDANRFTQLGAGQSEDFYVRVKATGSSFASAIQTVHASTNQASYTISIPSETQMVPKSGTASAGSISVAQHAFDLGYNGKIKVSVKSGVDGEGNITLKRVGDESTTIISRLYSSNTACGLNGILGTFDAAHKSAIPLSLSAPVYSGNVIPAGDYRGVVTFQVDYTEQ